MSIIKGHLLKILPTLDLPEDCTERCPKKEEGQRVEDGAHLTVTMNSGNSEHCVQIFRFFPAAFVEGLRFILHLFGLNVHRPAKFFSRACALAICKARCRRAVQKGILHGHCERVPAKDHA